MELHKEEFSKIHSLMGNLVDPVPMFQIVGMPYNGKHSLLCSFLKSSNVPHSTVDCSVFSEVGYSSGAALIQWKWSQFVKQLLDSIVASNPKEARRCSRLRMFEINSSQDLVKFLSLLLLREDNELDDPSSEKRRKCLAIVVDNYQDLISHDPVLLTTLLRLHEKLASPLRKLEDFKRKVVVIFVGPFPVPQEVMIGTTCIPRITVDTMTKEMCIEDLKKKYWDYSLRRAKEYFSAFFDDKGDSSVITVGDIELLWHSYVNYFVNTVYQWYCDDFNSLSFCCRLLWPTYLDPLAKLQTLDSRYIRDSVENGEHLCRNLDLHIRRMTQHYQSRFVADLQDSSTSNCTIPKKQLHKFHGSRLSKYLIIGAAISVMSHPHALGRKIEGKRAKRSRPSDKEASNYWNIRRNFDISSWIANTELVLVSNESDRIVFDSILYRQILWIIDEGYIKPISSAQQFRRLPVGRSGLIWNTTHHYCGCDRANQIEYSSQGNPHYLSQMLNQNVKFFLFAPNEMIGSIANDLSVNLSQTRLSLEPLVIHTRRLSTEAFDIFKKLKDAKDGGNDGSVSEPSSTRKPSDRVIKLVDEILNLTLIECADLCDLCQEKLAGKGPTFNGGYVPGRTPFPHPHTFFSGIGMMGIDTPVGATHLDANPGAATTTETPKPNDTPNSSQARPKEPEKETNTLKLIGFDTSKKIAVIKAIRLITGLGLRESKELVESFPRVIKKDIPREEAAKLAKQIEEAGGTIKLD